MDKERLRQYRHIKAEIARMVERQGELRRAASRASQESGRVPVKSGFVDPYPTLIDKIMVLDAVIAAKLCDLYAEEAAIEAALSKLDGRGRMIMRLRYLDGLSLREVADKMGYGYVHMRRMYGEYMGKIMDN